jgi:hypothetical protein
MKGKLWLSFFMAALPSLLWSQTGRWQQKVKYQMDVQLDVQTNKLTGKQKLTYFNQSPDTLKTIYYHLYWNAFQPNSMMDTRSRELGKQMVNGRSDWDARVRDRIVALSPTEIGYQQIRSLKMNGVAQVFTMHETILEVKLSTPILPRTAVVLDMEFEAQVPLQIRRSGRDNPLTGVRYSMSQWYPKICEYDYEGWHPTPYIAREFYGVWGDFEVNITLDRSYMIGGTGYLQNAQQIGFGYETPGSRVAQPAGKYLTWRFVAPNVHDFMWAADPEFKLIRKKAADGTDIHVLYKANPTQAYFNTLSRAAKEAAGNDVQRYASGWTEQWEKIANMAVTVLPFIEKNFGAYAYKQYSFIHGGDGGMEYPMATLMVSPSMGTAIHEWMHSWYQMMLGTNESLYGWMDEGFTSYAETLVSDYYEQATQQKTTQSPIGTGPRKDPSQDISGANPHLGAYNAYFALVKSGREEPLTTHADQFESNFAYSIASYSKGEVFLAQLGYIVGDSVRDQILLNYYSNWRFKHPNVNDFIRIAEQTSGMQLDWYRGYFVNSTKTIDYGIDSVWEQEGKTLVRIKRSGKMPMPIDVQIKLKDGSEEWHYVPMYLMFGQKPAVPGQKRTVYPAWKWTHPEYVIEVNRRLSDFSVIEIDPSMRMADINRKDNKLEVKW